jgi:hypothetical protein
MPTIEVAFTLEEVTALLKTLGISRAQVAGKIDRAPHGSEAARTAARDLGLLVSVERRLLEVYAESLDA